MLNSPYLKRNINFDRKHLIRMLSMCLMNRCKYVLDICHFTRQDCSLRVEVILL